MWFWLIVFVVFAGSLEAQSGLKGASRPNPQMSLANPNQQYKRIHQYALRLILRMRFDKAKSFLERHLAEFPEDAQTHYLMGVWHARKGEIKEATAWFGKAMECGLPASQMIAGRDLIRGFDVKSFFQKIENHSQHPILHGPLIGNVSDDSASFWIRSASANHARIIASTSADFSGELIFGKGQTKPEADFTGILRLTGLQADSTYFYKIEINDKPIQSIPMIDPPSFKTFPPKGQPSRFRLAFGGGAGFVPMHERAWMTIASFAPRLLLLLGDNVYIDDPESLLMQRFTYHRRQSRPEWQHLVSQTAVFTIWDDHDFGTNDCWGGSFPDEPFWKRHFVLKTFRENWANPAYARDDLPGCWYDFSVGDVDFLMLDCRYYRTNPKGENPTMLGPDQLRWLKKNLLSCQGIFKVICSSVPFDFRTKGKSLDTWNGYRKERESIFSFIEENRIEGVLLISADRHRSDAWRIERKSGYDFYEFNSSRLTNQHVHAEMSEAIFSYNKKQSFGLVDFDTTKADPIATYSVVNIDGEIIHKITITKNMLAFD